MKNLIKNVWLYDGSADSSLRRCDVLFDTGSVLAVEPPGTIGSSAADCEIGHGRGDILSPGFIDAHGHSDGSVFSCPGAESRIWQGISCEIAGNCGLSLFPVTELNREHLAGLFAGYGVDISWDDFASFRAAVDRINPAVNLEFFCGHNTLRAAAASYEKKELSPAEMKRMLDLLDIQIAQGALGVSFGLLYVPGVFAGRDEVCEVMRHVKSASVHLRSEGKMLIESMEEMLSAAVSAGLEHLQISHFKTAGADNWHKLPEALALAEEYGKSSLRIGFDRYPYLESLTSLNIVCPDEADDVQLSKQLANPENFEKLHRYLESCGRDWEKVRLVRCKGYYGKYAGMNILEIAGICRCDPALAVALILREDGGASAAFGGMCEENLQKIISLPQCVCGSDENARDTSESYCRSHPRAWGSFPEFIRRRLASGASPEAVLAQCTSRTAEYFSLPEHYGRLYCGGRPDMVLFSPDEIGSNADFCSAPAPGCGIRMVAARGRVYRF